MSEQEQYLGQSNKSNSLEVVNDQKILAAKYPRPPRSGIEVAFGIYNSNFNEYLKHHSYSLSLEETLERCSIMQDSKHPFVAYAAGSMMAELALSQDQPIDVADRLAAIHMAQEAWGRAGRLEGSTDASSSQKFDLDEGRQFQFHLTHDLCYVPTLELAARTIANDTSLEYDAWSAALEATRQNTDALAEILLSYPEGTDKVTGFINEVVAAKLIQRGATNRLILPASLRLDHNDNEDYRADLIALPLTERSEPTLLQVKNSEESADSTSTTRLFITGKDLALFPYAKPRQTLCYLLEEERLGLPYITDALDSLSNRLNQKIDTFEANQYSQAA